MKKFIFSFFLINSFSYAVTTTVKFVAKTNGPGITVEGEVSKANTKVNFNKLESTTFSTDVMDLVTGMDKRDKHLHEKVFNVSNIGMAKIDYSLSQINCPKDGANVECDCVGKLKIKDVENEIKFKANLDRTSNTISGKTTVSLNQFKLNSPTFMGISVLDDIEIDFKVSAK